MSNAAKKDQPIPTDEATKVTVDRDSIKFPRHILKKPVVASTRKSVINIIQQVMDELAAKSVMVQVENAGDAKSALTDQPRSLLFVDWNLGPDVAVQILKEGRGETDSLNLRPILLLIPNVTSEIAAIAMEYSVTKIFAGQMTATGLKEQIGQVRQVMEADQAIVDQLASIAEARNSGDKSLVDNIFSNLYEQYPNDLRLIVEYAEHLIETNQWMRAEVLLHPLWNREPPYLRALSAYSRCLVKKGSLSDAEGVLKRAKVINPYNVDRLISLGDVLLMSGKAQEAQDNFSEALQIDRSNKEAKAGKAKCQLLQDDINDALNLIKDIATPRELASIFNMAAVIASRGQKYEHSVKLYQTAIGLVGSDSWLAARLAFNQGLAFHKWDKPQEAREQFDLATKLDPAYAKASRVTAAMNHAKAANAEVDELQDSEESIVVAKAPDQK